MKFSYLQGYNLAVHFLCGLVTGQALFAGFSKLYRAKRKISKVCLQIIFVCRSETGLLAWVRKITHR